MPPKADSSLKLDGSDSSPASDSCDQKPLNQIQNELSLDPKVRLSPWSPPVEDEVKIKIAKIILIRVARLYFLVIHMFALTGLYYCVTGKVHLYTIIWALLLANLTLLGMAAGAHRLWSHNSYKAKWPVRLFLAVSFTASFQFSILTWVRTHRAHHKYVDTNGDPHNSSRGLFFSHIGWLLILPHPDALIGRRGIDTRDIEDDWTVKYNHKFFPPLGILLCYVLPTLVPWYFWGEDFWISHLVAAHLRQVCVLNATFLVNSVAHKWGHRPYDKNSRSAENILCSMFTCGEGWHNFHHVFPWDYRSAELGNLMKYTMNFHTTFIELCAKMGLTYDLKTASAEIVEKRLNRTGDTSHPHHHKSKRGSRGWNDKDLEQTERIVTLITNSKEMRLR